LCAGVNRIVFHRFAHQPWQDRRPGMTMGPYGVHWDRTQTWWPMVSAYHRYLARCQFLLRQGVTVADVCYLVPEGAPHVFRPPSSALDGEFGDRRGYSFDGCAPGTLLAGATVEHGRVTLPGGAAYALLVLPAFDTMTPALLRKIKDLAEAGATVVGSPPRKSPSLSDYPRCDDEVQSVAAALWGDPQPPSAVVKREVGEGHVLWGGGLAVAGLGQAVSSPIEGARWIWYPEGNPAAAAAPCTRYFRRVFTLDSSRSVETARVFATADNEFAIYVNGELAAKGDNFHLVYETDVRSLLELGKNVLAVVATNGGDGPNPAGFIAALRIEYEGGDAFEVFTDGDWQASLAPSEEWTTALGLGPADMAPWHLDPSAGPMPNLYPEYEATAGILGEMGVAPDFETGGPIRHTHRRTAEADIYFVANRVAEVVTAPCTFRVSGRRPELWNPLTGAMRDLPEFTEIEGRTTVPLRFQPYESLFVIFCEESDAAGKASREANFPSVTQVAEIGGPWEVSFDTALGGPERVRFETLIDWRERPEPGIRHYSGIATYRKTFNLPEAARAGGPVLLDIGEVRGMARVRLNGHDLGGVWCAPWRVDVTDALQAEENHLEIDVANLWPNRLIGDQALDPDQRIAWTTWNPYRADSALLESGLRGPVQIMMEETFPMIDYHVHLKGGLTLDDAKAWALEHGLRYGIAQNCGVNFPVTDDAGLLAYVEGMRGQGVYVGMQAEGREWVELFSPAALAQFDYIFTDAMTWSNDEGHRMRLWMPDEVVIGDPESFMDMLVERIVWILDNEPIDIYVNPTYVPAELAPRYDELWTDERVGRVIDAAVRNGVAIEISAGLKLPKPAFIKRAKAAGATFSFGTNNSGNRDLGNLEYCRQMIVECGLTEADMFVPKPDGQKAIQRKPLPKRKY